MDSRLEVKASHKMMEATIKTNKEQMEVSQEDMKATVTSRRRQWRVKKGQRQRLGMAKKK